MANFRAEVDKAVFATLNVQSLMDLATGGIFNTIAPSGAVFPIVIFNPLSKLDEYSFSGRYGNALYVVKAITDEQLSLVTASNIDGQIDTLMQDATLTITGFTHLLCRRMGDISFEEDISGAIRHHVGGQYRIIADEV